MSEPRRILVVDNDPAVRKGYEDTLSGNGREVVAAASGEDALWELGRAPFDVVITGLVMRGISGLDVAEEAQARQPGLPVAVVAGEGAQIAQTGAVAAVLRAPVAPALLSETVERMLQSARPAASARPVASPADAVAAQALPGPLARLKGIFLFLMAPFVGLVYILIFPIVGLGMLASMVQQEPDSARPLQPESPVAPRNILGTVATMLAVGVVGIACAVVAPILGIGLLLWFSIEAWGRLGARAMGT
jgi:CheY-like chemotaxis protein